MTIKPARIAAVVDTTTESFYVFPTQNPGSASVSAKVPDDPSCCSLAITDGDGDFFCAGLELQYNETQSSDVDVTITVPDSTWEVTQGTDGTAWTQITGTNSYKTTISKDNINNVVNGGDDYDDPFNFVNTTTGQIHDPAVRVTRPPSNGDKGDKGKR
jgi:hypothetical protein